METKREAEDHQDGREEQAGRRLMGFSVAGIRQGGTRDETGLGNKYRSKPDFPEAQMVKKQAARQETRPIPRSGRSS